MDNESDLDLELRQSSEIGDIDESEELATF